MKNSKFKLISFVMVAHVATYFLCGFIFMHLLGYDDYSLELLGFRPLDEINSAVLVLGQVVRGILKGFVVWWIKDSILGKKLAWLKLWAILVILGVVSTYGPVPGSIEGFIYLAPVDMPVNMVLSIFEVLLQPLLFSIIVAYQRKKKRDV
ncbi:MAG: hypothetical protein FWC69_02185 [Defluviitaleaceae bacterium]|nr:hypothetical protein [Defluviitaleaceae bacterium]